MALPVCAAPSADLQVKGIITPAACTPTLSDSGIVDYRNIDPNDLSRTSYTVLTEKRV